MSAQCLSSCGPCSQICKICQDSYDNYMSSTRARLIDQAKCLLEANGYTVVSQVAVKRPGTHC